MPLPILLDTDIGTDIDDAYALLLAATSPELSLLGVCTVNNDTVLRARIARKLLNLGGRADVPVTAGRSESYLTRNPPGWMGHEGEGIDLADPALAPDEAGLGAFVHRVIENRNSLRDPLTIITIGALTNVAWLLEHLPPETMMKVRRIVAMASNWNGFGRECARREHNVACDPIAFDRVLKSGIPITIVGLNVTCKTSMSEDQLNEIEEIDGPLAELLIGMHRIWFDIIGRRESPMHDALAVAAAFEPALLTTIPVTAETAGSDGTVVYNEPAAGQVTHLEIATGVDVDAFQTLFWGRIRNAVRASRRTNGQKN